MSSTGSYDVAVTRKVVSAVDKLTNARAKLKSPSPHRRIDFESSVALEGSRVRKPSSKVTAARHGAVDRAH